MFPRMTTLAGQALQALPFTVHTVDLDGRITSVNRNGERGDPAFAIDEGIPGRSILEVLDASSRARAASAMEALRTGRATVVAWETARDDDTTGRVLLHHVAPLQGDDRAVEGFVFATVDITASHQAREAMLDVGGALARTLTPDQLHRELARQLRLAVDAQAHALALVERDGTARLTHAVGWAESADALVARQEEAWRAAIATGETRTREADGGVELTAPVPGDEGARIGALTVLVPDRHATDLARLTLALRAIAAHVGAAIIRERLARAAAEAARLDVIAEVATGVAHELRTPLFGISSAVQLLRFRSQEDPVVERNVGRILREVERLNRMTTSLLEYGRTDTGVLERGDPEAVWDEVVETNRGLLESRALILRRTRAERPPDVRLDAERLAQVFTNVLANAMDHAPEASDLTLTGETLPDGSWRCRLHNGGPAIPPDVLPRVFDIFFSTRAGGSGIGLALCQRILRDHGGTITLESSAASGTTATITLPRSA